jgi:hypothetical protein
MPGSGPAGCESPLVARRTERQRRQRLGAAAAGWPGTPVYQPFLCARASYSRTDADTDTFSESADPSIGIPTR